jgi:UDP:flavonoid glycosyltransferase YjiC (YdhE family)
MRVVCSSIPSNDLGLPSRLLPVAQELRSRGHEVAFSNPAPVPAELIARAGFANLPWPIPRVPPPSVTLTPPIVDVDHLLMVGFADPSNTANQIENWKLVIREWEADVVLDSFGPAGCTAARLLDIPYVQVLQADFHPDSRFTWWLPPQQAPSPVASFNAVLEAAGHPPVDRAARLLLGTATVVVGAPSTDPVPDPTLPHAGALIWEDPHSRLPDSLPPPGERPLVFLYGGNTYGRTTGPGVVVESAIQALGGLNIDVVIGTGNQDIPEPLPRNVSAFRYVSGPAMARRADVMIHLGGHSSTMTALATGTPALVVPTYSERESNARRVANLGSSLCLTPQGTLLTGMTINAEQVAAAVNSLINDPSYRDAAQAVSEELCALGGARGVADVVESII